MTQVGDPLPRANEAEVPLEKFTDYLLNPGHLSGCHKARVFEAALGLALEHAEMFRDQVATGIAGYPVVDARPCYNGTRCEVQMTIHGPDGRDAVVRTGWRIPDDGGPPHFLTAYLAI